jgi:hypothetical protein
MIDEAEEKEVLQKSSSNMANESNFMTTQKLFPDRSALIHQKFTNYC